MAAIRKLLLLLALLVITAASLVLYWSREPLLAANAPAVEFNIAQGSSVRSAMRQVRDAGVPAPPLLMELLARGFGQGLRGFLGLVPHLGALEVVERSGVRNELRAELLRLVPGGCHFVSPCVVSVCDRGLPKIPAVAPCCCPSGLAWNPPGLVANRFAAHPGNPERLRWILGAPYVHVNRRA